MYASYTVSWTSAISGNRSLPIRWAHDARVEARNISKTHGKAVVRNINNVVIGTYVNGEKVTGV